MVRIVTPNDRRQKLDAFFGPHKELIADFKAFINDADNKSLISISFENAKYYLSRLVSRVPKSMHWDAMTMYDRLHKYTIDEYRQDLMYALMNQWYIKITHTMYSGGLRKKLEDSDIIEIHEALSQKDETVMNDLKEAAFEVARELDHNYVEIMLHNLVTPFKPTWLEKEE